MREVTLANARWFQGPWVGDQPASRYVRSVWNPKYRRSDEKFMSRPVFPLSRFVEAFLERRSDWDEAGLQGFLAELVIGDFELQVRQRITSFPLAELHLPDIPEGLQGSLTVSGVRSSFKQLNYALHNAPNFGDATSRIALLSGYEMTLSMLLIAAWHGEQKEVLTGLPLLDSWMNAMSEGLQEYVLPETKRREKLYRLRLRQQIERSAGSFTTHQNLMISELLQAPLDQHVTEVDFRSALMGVLHDRD